MLREHSALLLIVNCLSEYGALLLAEREINKAADPDNLAQENGSAAEKTIDDESPTVEPL